MSKIAPEVGDLVPTVPVCISLHFNSDLVEQIKETWMQTDANWDTWDKIPDLWDNFWVKQYCWDIFRVYETKNFTLFFLDPVSMFVQFFIQNSIFTFIFQNLERKTTVDHFANSRLKLLVTVCLLSSFVFSCKCQEIKFTVNSKTISPLAETGMKSEFYGSAAAEEAFAKLNSIKVKSTLVKKNLQKGL